MIIALAQTGIGDAEVNELEENAAYDLTKVEGSDAIISGHSHYAFPGNDRNLPEVDLEKEKEKWVVKNPESELRAIYDKTTKRSLADPDNEVLKAVKEVHEETLIMSACF